MMRIWRRLGVDHLLKAAYENGTVLAGISAGSICWFDSGHSDSMSFYNPRNWKDGQPFPKLLVADLALWGRAQRKDGGPLNRRRYSL